MARVRKTLLIMPTAGLRVIDPATRAVLLPDVWASVADTVYWRRRIQDLSVRVSADATPPTVVPYVPRKTFAVDSE